MTPEGAVALVTGSTQGIGHAIAAGLGAAGFRIVRHGGPGPVPTPEPPPVPGELGVLHADFTEPGAARRLGAAARDLAGRVDVLVLCASVQVVCAWEEVTPEQVWYQFQVNFQSSLDLIQELVPGMRDAGWGRVLAIGSVQHTKQHDRMLAYGASKAAQFSMVRNLAKQLAPFGVTVNSLSPGITDTERNREALSDPEEYELIRAQIPVGRIAVPGDYTAAAVYLCSAESAYVTGLDLVVDGGFALP